jgi:predicted DNA-binding transcriptional regulator AlpA
MLLRRAQAAAYCGVSPVHFDKLVREGVFPQPRRVSDNIKAWDARDLIRAIDDLPYAGEPAPDDSWN